MPGKWSSRQTEKPSISHVVPKRQEMVEQKQPKTSGERNRKERLQQKQIAIRSCKKETKCQGSNPEN